MQIGHYPLFKIRPVSSEEPYRLSMFLTILDKYSKRGHQKGIGLFMSPNEPTRHEVASFDDVMPPAQSYKQGFPTIIHLTAEPKDVGRRIIVLFSGLVVWHRWDF